MPAVNAASFPCTYLGCRSVFKHAPNRIRHIRRAHNNISMPCPLCGKIFKSIELMQRHVKKHAQTPHASPRNVASVTRQAPLPLTAYCSDFDKYKAMDIGSAKQELIKPSDQRPNVKLHRLVASSMFKRDRIDFLENEQRWILVGKVQLQQADRYMDSLQWDAVKTKGSPIFLCHHSECFLFQGLGQSRSFPINVTRSALSHTWLD